MVKLPLLLLVLCNIFTLLGVYSIYTLLIGSSNLKKTAVVTVFFSVFTAIVIGSYDWLLMPTTIIGVGLVACLANEGRFKTNIFSILLACILQIFISEISVYLSYSFVYKITDIENEVAIGISFCALTSVFTCILILLLRAKANILRQFMYNEKSQISILGFTAFLFLLIYIIQIFIDLSEKNRALQLGFILIFCIVLILNDFFLRTYVEVEKKQSKIREQNEKNGELQKYLKELSINYNQLRAFKHDFQNILVTIELMAQDNNELKNYISKITKHSHSLLSNQVDLLSLERISNLPLKSLILSKILTARAKNISFYLEVEKPLKHLFLNDTVIIRIVSILLDNAIEYGANSHNDSHVVLLIDNYEELGYDIVIENDIDLKDNETFSLEKWFTLYTSKGEGHGIGLNSVKGIINNETNLSLNVEIIKQRIRFTLMVGDTNA